MRSRRRKKIGFLKLFCDGGVCGVEHSHCAFIELEDKAFFGVYADAVAGKLSVILKRYTGKIFKKSQFTRRSAKANIIRHKIFIAYGQYHLLSDHS